MQPAVRVFEAVYLDVDYDLNKLVDERDHGNCRELRVYYDRAVEHFSPFEDMAAEAFMLEGAILADLW